MRTLAWYMGAFSAGIFAAQYLLPSGWLPWCALAALAAACARLILPGYTGRRALLIGAGLAFAFGWNWLYTRNIVEPMRELSGTECELSMTLCDYPEEAAFGARVTVDVENFPGRLVYYGKTSILGMVPGQILYDRVRFQDAARLREDELTVFTSRGIFLLAYGRGNPVEVDVTDSPDGWSEIRSSDGWSGIRLPDRWTGIHSPRWWPVRTAHAAAERIHNLLPGDSAAFLTALLVGDRSGLSVQAAADISEAGLSHILAVSGMHCGFLLAVVMLLTGWYHRHMVALCAIPLLIFYAVLTGTKPSVVRACVMLIFVLIAPLCYRASDSPTSLCAALFLILLWNPYAAASVSLQLSFASVAGLLSITPPFYAVLSGEKVRFVPGKSGPDTFAHNLDTSGGGPEDDDLEDGGGPEDDDDLEEPDFQRVRLHPQQVIRSLLAASFSATVGVIAFTAPLSAYYFGFLPLVMFLSNPLCLWAAGGAFVSGLLTLAVSILLPPLAPIAALVPEMLSRYILLAASMLAKIPFHAVYFENPFLGYWLVYVYVLCAAAYLLWRFSRRDGWSVKGRGIPVRRRKVSLRRVVVPVGLCVMTLVVTLFAGWKLYRAPLDVLALDVGQGESVLFASGGRFALLDCGSGNSWYDAGVIAAHQLGGMGTGRLDALILSHYDADHVNGVEDLMARVKIGMLLVPTAADDNGWRDVILTAAEAQGIPVEFVEERERFRFGDSILTVFPPVGLSGDNDRGLSVLVSVGDTDVLVTGDMDAQTERILMDRYELPDLEVFFAGHHGSKYSTSDELLDALMPELVCISVGSNSYGHPTEETLSRLRAHGCTVLRTDLYGTIHLALYPD